MMKSILLGSAAALAISTSAFAADAIYEAPAEPPVAVETVPQFSWAGGYAGILTGYGWADGDVEGFGTESFDGARLGGFVGYNWDLGNQLVVGEVLDADVSADFGVGESLKSSRTANTVDVCQCNFHALFAGNVYSGKTCHGGISLCVVEVWSIPGATASNRRCPLLA